MTQTTPERQPCGTCGKPCSVNADGTVRHHLTDNPDFQAGPDSRKCKGAGQPPAGAAGLALAEDMAAEKQPQCRLCKHPVELTSNGRARSHLTTEQTPRPCPGGSDFPLGMYPDIVGTTDGRVATLVTDCGHVPAGQCYGCHGAAGKPVSDAELDAMAEAEGTGAAPWGVASAAMQQPTMADQFTTAAVSVTCGCGASWPSNEEMQKVGHGLTQCPKDRAAGPSMAGEYPFPKTSPLTALMEREAAGVGTVLDAMDGDTRTEAEQFMDATVPTQPTAQNECTHDRYENFGLKAGVRCVACNAQHPDPHAYAADVAISTVEAERDEVNRQHAEVLADVRRRAYPEGVYCEQCDTDNHRCPGCGTDVPHGTVACPACTRETCTHPHGFIENDPVDDDGEDLVFRCGECGAVGVGDKPAGPDPELPNCSYPETHRAGCGCPDDDSACREPEDGWRTPLDLMEKMPEDVRGLDALRLNCVTCDHPVTPLVDYFAPDGRAARVVWACENHLHATNPCRDHECSPDTRARLGELDEGDYFLRNGTLMRLTERESGSSVLAEVMDGPYKGRTGELKNLNEVVQRAPEPQAVEEPEGQDCKPQDKPSLGPVRVGDLEHGDVFIRRGTAMRVTSAGYGLVEAIVVDNGPHAGRTGELRNPDEVVDRAPCRHEFAWADDGKFGHAGSFCDYCGAPDPADQTKGQETTECTDDRTPQQRPASSAASTPTTTRATTDLAPGSRPPTPASAPAVSPKSGSVTSSAPTARAAGNGGSAAVTTDQASAAAAFLGSGRPTASASAGPANQADAAAQFLAGGSGAHGEKETKRDRFGRYLIPHPDTGKETAWTRSTTFAKSISDTYALSQWGLRMALLGATMRPDIVRRAHGKHVRADKALLDELTAELKNAAGDKVAANLGTAMHSFTEMADRAWHSPGGPRSILDQVPPDCREMVETYIRLLEETGLEPVPHLIEFTTVVKQYGVAGTSDNCYKVTKPLTLKIGRAEVRFQPGEYVIGDKKTGRDLDYGWQEIAIQLSTYAQGINTAGVWDRHDEVWEPDPLSRFDKPGTKVRTDAGVVIHLPVDQESEKMPTVYGVDLESGWNAAVLCERVRAWRKVRTLASPVMVSDADTFAPARSEPAVTSRTTVRPPSLMDKARAVTSKSEASAVWKEAKTAGLSDAEVDRLVGVMQSRLKELAEPGG
jgi:hypothetical protein